MNMPYFSKLLFSCLFFLSFISSAQNQTEQYVTNGLSTTIFNLPQGKITVYLPEYEVGETISGTIKLGAVGNTNNKKKKNLAEITSYKITLEGQSILLSQNVFKIAPITVNYELSLKDAKDNLISTSTIGFDSNKRSKTRAVFIPSYVILENPARIHAPSDGVLGNNGLTVNNREVPILAESESATYFIPRNIPAGQSVITFNNNGEIEQDSCNILNLELSVGDTNLLRGQSTDLNIRLTGLNGLDKEVPMTISNQSAENISLVGGNNQELIVDSSNDTFDQSIRIYALQRGGFSISVNVVPDEVPDEVSDETLCNCYLNNETHLISPEACEELGGSCIENRDDGEEIEDNARPPSFDLDFPNDILVNEKAVLSVNDHYGDDCLAVAFYHRSTDAEEWQFIGSDNTPQDGLSFEWTPTLNDSGAVVIKAQVVNKNNVISESVQQIWLSESDVQLSEELLQNVAFTVSQEDIDREWKKAGATGERIKEEEEKKRDLENDKWDEIDSKKKNEDAKNELVAIDEVIERIPKVYKDSLRVLIDSLRSLRGKLPVKIDTTALNKAVDDAQKRVDDCNERLEKLKEEQEQLEKERDRLKAETDAALEEMDALMRANGLTGGYGYHPDGRYWYGYVGDERSNGDVLFSEEHAALKKKLRGLKKEYLKTLKRLGQLPAEIEEAQEDCDELNEALEKAKEAVKNADLHMATEVAVEDICRQIRSLIRPLWRWCLRNPDYCDFKDELRELLEECPRTNEDLESFWDKLNDIIKSKKEKEKAFGEAADKDQDDINGIDDEIEEIEDKIKALKAKQAQEYAEAERKRQQRLKELAEAKARAEARKRERNKQKKEDDKIKELIKKAKSDEAGDKAFKDLLKGMGLDLLDEASGNLKLGKIIDGLLVIKDMPNCVCEMLTALQKAFVAARNGPEGPAVYVEAYLLAWKKCANLPSISSVSIGGSEMTEAINNMSRAQLDRAIKALNQALRVQCK